MPQMQPPPETAFLRNVLIRLASFSSIALLLIGLLFLLLSHFGWARHLAGAGVTIVSGGAALAILSLIGASFVNFRLDAELKEAAQIAARISEGDTGAADDFDEGDSELKTSLREIAIYLGEKAAISNRIATGDLGAEIAFRSDRDRFGEAFQNMIDRLRVLVQTEEERDRLQKSILKLRSEVSEVAAGDLTVNADTTPEITGAIAAAFNSMTSELRSLIGQVKETAFQVSSSASAISDTTEQLARGSEAQSSQISLTTSAISNMAAQIQGSPPIRWQTPATARRRSRTTSAR
jgi:methyl-accepting chemotaxis protein